MLKYLSGFGNYGSLLDFIREFHNYAVWLKNCEISINVEDNKEITNYMRADPYNEFKDNTYVIQYDGEYDLIRIYTVEEIVK